MVELCLDISSAIEGIASRIRRSLLDRAENIQHDIPSTWIDPGRIRQPPNRAAQKKSKRRPRRRHKLPSSYASRSAGVLLHTSVGIGKS